MSTFSWSPVYVSLCSLVCSNLCLIVRQSLSPCPQIFPFEFLATCQFAKTILVPVVSEKKNLFIRFFFCLCLVVCPVLCNWIYYSDACRMSLKSTSLSLRDVISLTVRPSLSFKSWERIKVFNPCFLVRPFNRFVYFFLVLICQTSRLPALTSYCLFLSLLSIFLLKSSFIQPVHV